MRGLLQGSILSPILFNYFIDDLARELNSGSHPTRQKALLYAEDIVLFHESQTGMQELLDITTRWLTENGMTISIGKCGAMNCPESAHLRIQNEEIQRVGTYQYLLCK
jgi:retron-type reverse transcriptase